MALEEIRRFMLAGGGTVVDATDWDLGRDPLALARISRATGLNIVMGSGHYVPTFRPADMADRSEESITERLVRDISLGVGDTGIKSGLIGEIGNVHPSDDIQRKVLRASAQAQVETGAPILIHPGIEDTSSGEILDVLVAAGANPKHTIMGHLDYSVRDWGHLKALAETGCLGQGSAHPHRRRAHRHPRIPCRRRLRRPGHAGARRVPKSHGRHYRR